MTLTAAQKQRLAADGYVVVPGLVPDGLVGAALREINHGLGLTKRPNKDAYADSHDYLSQYVSTPAIMDLLHKSPAWPLAESLLGAGRIEEVTQAQIALRFPSERDDSVSERTIHVDGLYSKRDGVFSKRAGKTRVRYTLGLGVMLSDVPRPDMGNFTVYPGSHRLIADKIKKGGLESLKTGLENNLKLPPPVQVTGKAGDVVLFNYQLAHDKERNISADIRYMIYFRLWHTDAWADPSVEATRKALEAVWREWPGMRGVRGT